LSPVLESENGGQKCNDVCAHLVERGVAGREKGRDTKEVLARAWCGASSRRQTRPSPSLENHAVGSFLEARAGRFTARRAKETIVFKVRGEAAVEIIKAGSEDEGVDPSLAFVESCPPRFDERGVVATVFGPDGEEICDFDSRALHGRIAPTKTSSSSLRPPDRDVPGELRAAGGATGRARQEICSEMRFDTLV